MSLSPFLKHYNLASTGTECVKHSSTHAAYVHISDSPRLLACSSLYNSTRLLQLFCVDYLLTQLQCRRKCQDNTLVTAFCWSCKTGGFPLIRTFISLAHHFPLELRAYDFQAFYTEKVGSPPLAIKYTL